MTPQFSVGAEQVAAHLKACTESREELLAALKHLVAEVTGFVGYSELELRQIAGHTNVNVLLRRLDEARIALAKDEASRV